MQFRAHARRVVQVGGGTTLALASMLSASRADAQGFGLNEIGTCAIGRGFAVTGAPCEDASVLYWNPGAAATMPRGLSAYGGVSAVQVKGAFTADYTRREYEGDVPIELPPFLGVTWKGAGRLALGVAAYVPYGLTSQWRDDFPGRFSAQKASLQTIYAQPTIAYEIVPGRLSIGGGPVIGYSRLELRQSLDFSTQPINRAAPTGPTFAALGFAPGTEFGVGEVKGDGTGFGYNLGIHAKLTPTFSVGARYLSEVRFDYEEAEATFTPSAQASQYVIRAGNPLLAQVPGLQPGATLANVVAPQFTAGQTLGPNQTASTRIDHPAQFQVGVGFTGIANTTLSADYALIRWTSFQELPVNFTTADGQPSVALSRTLIEDYEDSHSFRAGLEHRFGGGVAGRAGFSYATTPAPDVTVTPLLPDMDRYNFNVGLGLPLGERFALDAGYLRVETEGRRGRTGERASRSESAESLNNGFYALNANIFSVSLKARF
ncbi:MAG: OmpP1/FadL family transporter [Gemmatirosa sp.]